MPSIYSFIIIFALLNKGENYFNFIFIEPMKKCTRLLCALLLGGLMASSVSAQAATAKKKKQQTQTVTTGAQDRAFWVKSLYDMVWPVVHNLAEGTLRKNMPVEAPKGYTNAAVVTHLEAVGRTLSGLAPWLELPDDNTEEGKLRKKVREETLKGLRNAVDPSNPDYLNFRRAAQPIVDAAYLAEAFFRAPKALWEPLDAETKKRYAEEFKALRDRTGAYNNWLIFAGLNESFLCWIGEKPEPVRLQYAKNKIEEWFVGDGCYSDGPHFSMDYYNDYVINPMLVDMLAVLKKKGRASQSEYDRAFGRLVRRAEIIERFISPEGHFPVVGRSSTYRTAAFQSLALVALMQKLPSYIKPAQVRCALTKVFHNMYDGRQNYDENGWLVLGFNGHQPEIADYYTSTGSLYMATLGFLPLGLPADNPFWADPAEPWTSVKAWNGMPFKHDP